MDNANQYSVVVLPKEAWDEIVKILGELKAKVGWGVMKKQNTSSLCFYSAQFINNVRFFKKNRNFEA